MAAVFVTITWSVKDPPRVTLRMKYARVAGTFGLKCAGRAPKPPIVAAWAPDANTPKATANAVASSERVFSFTFITER